MSGNLHTDGRADLGLRVLALRTPTLPPATCTNVSLVGCRRVWVVDPASPHAAERERLRVAVAECVAEGATVMGVVLTHHHADHVGAAAWFARSHGVPILAHERTRRILQGSLRVDGVLAEGDVLDGGGGPSDHWEVLHTPGHASGHIVLWEPTRGLMVAGDMVASEGTIIVDPPDGHMGTYMASLERLKALSPTRLVPAHGDVVEAPVALLEYYLAHRLAREQKVLEALQRTPLDLMAVTRASYPGLAPGMLGFASRSTLAHLLTLEGAGRALAVAPDRWTLGAGNDREPGR